MGLKHHACAILTTLLVVLLVAGPRLRPSTPASRISPRHRRLIALYVQGKFPQFQSARERHLQLVQTTIKTFHSRLPKEWEFWVGYFKGAEDILSLRYPTMMRPIRRSEDEDKDLGLEDPLYP